MACTQFFRAAGDVGRDPGRRRVDPGRADRHRGVFGAFMNWNYIMAGSASTNGWLGMLSIFLILAWKVAGWYGLDRWLLPLLGTPWQPGELRGALAPHS